MSGRDFNTELDADPGFYDDSAACRREARRVARSTTLWVYVIIFMLLFFIFLFVLLIYGKVKGFAIKPTMMTGPTSLRKPGRVFTGTVGFSAEENDEEEE